LVSARARTDRGADGRTDAAPATCAGTHIEKMSASNNVLVESP